MATPTLRLNPWFPAAELGVSTPAKRWLLVDVFRGLIMLCLVSEGFGLRLLGPSCEPAWLCEQVEHGYWSDVTFWDTIQPAFTFVVGMAMPAPAVRRDVANVPFGKGLGRALRRSVGLVALSVVLRNFRPGLRRPVLSVMHVLFQIGAIYWFCYLVAQLPLRNQFGVAALLLAGHTALYAAFPGGDGAFSMYDNVGARIDRFLLGEEYVTQYAAINFLTNAVTILSGSWVMELLVRAPNHRAAFMRLGSLAAVLIVAGLALEPWVPIVKKLWTATFTLYSTGLVIATLALCYWAVEVLPGYRHWFPIAVVGMNSIFIFSFYELLRSWLHRGLAVFTGNFAFLGETGIIVQNLACVLVMWYLCYWLYRHRVFVRI